MMEKGIDISHWNVVTDFKKIKEAGYSFVIIKAGGSDGVKRYTDVCFEDYCKRAKEAGLKVGCYYFAGKGFHKGYTEGIADARHFLKIIGGKKFEYPIYLDVEAMDKRFKKSITEACNAFCELCESRNYYVGIYGSDVSTFAELVDISQLKKYDKWVARYGNNPKYVKSFGVHQYSSTGTVSGIKGKVDLDTSYVDYALIMKRCKLNGG